MRVLFFTDIVRHFGFDPIGVMSLSAQLRRAGHQTRLVSHPRNLHHVQEHLESFQPDILAFSVTTGIHRSYLDLNLRIKEKHAAFSVFGGAHTTFFPETVEREGVDAICIGEGEGAMVDLANALDCGESPNEIANLWVKDNDGQIHRNPLRPLVADLDSLAVPDREMALGNDKSASHGIVNMVASRGCPYQCTYCYNHVYKKLYIDKGPLVRRRSVRHVVAEANALQDRYAPQMVTFVDDCLTLNKPWFREFAEAWATEVKLPFTCNARFDLLDEEIVALLKKARCDTVVASVETGNDDLRNNVLKHRMTRQQIIEGAALVRQYGMGLLVQGILGLPLGSLEADMETLDVIARTRPSNAAVTIFQPYPGTELGKLAMEKGLCKVGPDDIPETYRTVSILDLPEKKRQERLCSLFGLAVEFRLVRATLPVLLRLPVRGIGGFLTRLWNGYCARFRLYPSLKYSWTQTCVNALKYIVNRGG